MRVSRMLFLFLIVGAIGLFYPPTQAAPVTPFDSPTTTTDLSTEQISARDLAPGHALAPGDLVNFDAALITGADYLRAMQADVTDDNAGNGTNGVNETPDDPDDAGWDWRVTSPPAPFHHTTAASSTNLYGATAQGLYYAYLETGDPTYFTALQDYADRAVAAGPDTIRTGTDMKMLMLFNDLYSAEVAPTTVYADAAKAKYDGRIAAWGGTATALAQYIRDVRNGQGYGNGIIAWDIGIYAVAAQMLYASYGGTYDQDADDIAEVLWQDSFNDNPGYFDIVDDAGFDPTYADYNFYWYNLGVTGLIDAFSASGSYTADIPGLVQQLLNSQYDGGGISFSYGANPGDEDWQSTGYAAMCLGNLDQTTHQDAINRMGYWIGATQDASGGWVYSSGNHYPEIGGEVTAGLYFTTNDLTYVLVDDDFIDQATVDAYNAANGTNYTWGYDAFATINDAMAAVNGSTIYVNAGTYYETLNITLAGLSIIGENRATVIIDPTGLATNNAGLYVAASNVTLQGFTVNATPTTSLPRYGLKVGAYDGVVITDVTVEECYRSGFDMLGASNLTLTNIAALNNGGHGLALTDCNTVAITDLTVSGSGWQGVSIATWGRYTPLGTSGILFSGSNTFTDVFQLEMGDYNNPGVPPAGDAIITYSTDILDGADVTVQAADFGFAVHGTQDDAPDQARIWFVPTLSDAASVLAAAPIGHFTGVDMYIEDLVDQTQLYVAPGGTIQAAVDAADPGDAVNVLAGTYVEQVVIDKNLTLSGADQATTFVHAPATLPAYFVTGTNNNRPILYAHDADAAISGFTIDGLNLGNANYRFVGIGFWNAGGSVADCYITGITDTPFSGSQHGNGIYAYNNTGGPYAIAVTNVDVDDFQKNGITLLGEGLTVAVNGCNVTGIGPTTITAQNGIQLGYGSGGTITDCTVDGIAWIGTGWIASSILLYQGTTVDITNSTVTNGQACVIYQETNGTASGLTVAAAAVDNTEGVSVRDYGYVKSSGKQPPAISPADGFLATADIAKAAPTMVSIEGATLVGAGNSGYGVAAWSLGDDATVSVTNSNVSGWEIGLVSYEDGSVVDLSAAYNSIAGNTYGMWTNAAAAQIVEDNYWGSFAGPVDVGGTLEATVSTCYPAADMMNTVAEVHPALGDTVDGLADYCPWVSSGVVFTATNLVHHCPGNITFDVATTAAVEALEGANIAIEFPAELSFAGATVADPNFQLLPITQSADGTGYDTLYIPFIIKTNWLDGAAHLYTVSMAATNDICTADHITMLSADLRDTANASIATPLPAPIDVTVDCEDPVFATTTPDGGYYNAPPVLDISATDNCDLAAIYYQLDGCNPGLWTALASNLTGTAYADVWTLPQAEFVALTEVSHCLRFKVVDDASRGNGDSCTFTWCFTKDVSAPPPPTNLAAEPGHNKVKLSWVNAASDFDHTIVMRTDWNAAGHGYPEYGSLNGNAEGPYPTDTITGDYIVATTLTSHTDTDDLSNVTRDVYHYAAFTVDAAGNISTAATARSTSYWIGDVAGAGGFGDYDGYVYAEDLNPLTIVYGSAEGNANFDAQLDYGPSTPGGAKDIPIPDDSINFEDGILFAINFDIVNPTMKASPLFIDHAVTGPLAVSLTPVAEGCELALVNNAGEVKGVHVVVSYGPGATFGGATLSAPVRKFDQPLFTKTIAGSDQVTFDLILLGEERTIIGSGPLVTLSFTGENGQAPEVTLHAVDLRDRQNGSLAAEMLTNPTAGLLPATFALEQNFPNPFNPSTAISYRLPTSGQVRLEVFNMLGQRVRRLVDQFMEAGNYTATWDSRDETGERVSSGIYLYRMTAGEFTETRKMMLLK